MIGSRWVGGAGAIGTYLDAALLEEGSVLVLKDESRVFKADELVLVVGKNMASPPGKTVT